MQTLNGGFIGGSNAAFANQTAHAQVAQINEGAMGYAPTAVSPLARMGNAIAVTEQAIVRLEMLADQLCGAVPQPVQDGGKNLGGGGLFGAVNQAADQLSGLAERAERALGRIQSQLP